MTTGPDVPVLEISSDEEASQRVCRKRAFREEEPERQPVPPPQRRSSQPTVTSFLSKVHDGLDLNGRARPMPALDTLLRNSKSTSRAYITDAPLYHIRQATEWSCGYANFQALCAMLRLLDDYKPLFQALGETSSQVASNGNCVDVVDTADVPPPNTGVPQVYQAQQWLEEAWHMGYDPTGAHQLEHKVVDTDKWIGATEVAVLLLAMGIEYRSHLCKYR